MTNAITTRDNDEFRLQRQTIANLFDNEDIKAQIAKVLPEHLTPTRMLEISLSIISGNEKLLKCTAHSLLKAVMDAGRVGLEPTGKIGGGYLVPYWNSKIGAFEAQFQTDYRGEIALVTRTGMVKDVDAFLIFEHDDYEQIDERNFVHKPNIFMKKEGKLTRVNRGACLGVYAEALMADGRVKKILPLTCDDVERYRARSKQKDSGPWVDDWDAMAKKTAIRRLCDKLPKSVEYQEYLQNDPDAIDVIPREERLEIAAEASPSNVVPIQGGAVASPQQEPEAPKPNAAQRLTESIKEKQASEIPPPATRAKTDESPKLTMPSTDPAIIAREAKEMETLKAEYDSLWHELKHLVSEDPKRTKTIWDEGVQSMRGVKTPEHLLSRVIQARALVAKHRTAQLELSVAQGKAAAEKPAEPAPQAPAVEAPKEASLVPASTTTPPPAAPAPEPREEDTPDYKAKCEALRLEINAVRRQWGDITDQQIVELGADCDYPLAALKQVLDREKHRLSAATGETVK